MASLLEQPTQPNQSMAASLAEQKEMKYDGVELLLLSLLLLLMLLLLLLLLLLMLLLPLLLPLLLLLLLLISLFPNVMDLAVLYYPAADVHLIGPQLVEVQQADVGFIAQVD
jgi:hypothetical protein